MVTPCRDELTICDHYNSQLTILVEVDQLTFDRIRHRLSPRRKSSAPRKQPDDPFLSVSPISTSWISHTFSLVLIHYSILIGSVKRAELIAVLRTNLHFTIESQELQSQVASDQPAFVLTDWELIAAEIDSDVDATLGHSVQS